MCAGYAAPNGVIWDEFFEQHQHQIQCMFWCKSGVYLKHTLVGNPFKAKCERVDCLRCTLIKDYC